MIHAHTCAYTIHIQNHTHIPCTYRFWQLIPAILQQPSLRLVGGQAVREHEALAPLRRNLLGLGHGSGGSGEVCVSVCCV